MVEAAVLLIDHDDVVDLFAQPLKVGRRRGRARTGDPKRAARSAAVPVAATDLRKRRRLCLSIVIIPPSDAVVASTGRRPRDFREYHRLMTVVRSGAVGRPGHRVTREKPRKSPIPPAQSTLSWSIIPLYSSTYASVPGSGEPGIQLLWNREKFR
jgi:hypothetical protein